MFLFFEIENKLWSKEKLSNDFNFNLYINNAFIEYFDFLLFTNREYSDDHPQGVGNIIIQ